MNIKLVKKRVYKWASIYNSSLVMVNNIGEYRIRTYVQYIGIMVGGYLNSLKGIKQKTIYQTQFEMHFT